MGSFFGNLHLRTPGPEALEAVRRALDTAAAKAGLRPAAPEEEPDRTVVLLGTPGWLSVYDEQTDADPEALAAQAATVSAGLEGTVITAAVHDSDVLWLGRWDRGRATDRYDSNPGYFGKKKRGQKRPEEHVRAWADLLVPGHPPESLSPVFAGGEVFAESALEPLAAALGLPPDRLRVGYRYLLESPLPAGATVLRYRTANRPAWEQTASGLPVLRTHLEQQRALLAERGGGIGFTAPLQQAALTAEVRCSVTSRNLGGSGTGLVVTVEPWTGTVCWEQVQLVLGNPRECKVVTLPFQGGRAVFAEVALVAGSVVDPMRMDTPPTSVAAVHKMMEAQLVSQVHVNLIGRATSEGQGRWRVRLVPLANEAGGAEQEVAIEVRGTEGRPLKAPPSVHPSLLAPLEGRDHLVLLVVAAVPGALGEVLAPMVQTLGPFWPTEGRLMSTLFAGMAPKLSSVKASGFLKGKRWTGLLDALREGAGMVHVTWGEAESGPSTPTASLMLGRGIIPGPAALPALAVALREGPADLKAAAQVARSAVDRAMAQGQVVQALLVRWGAPAGLDTTPYELACGIHGQCTLESGWVTRWLRGLGVGTLWLGPELAARVDAAALARVAEVRSVGSGLAVEVADVAAVERALSDLLPDGAAWQAGMRLRYAPPGGVPG